MPSDTAVDRTRLVIYVPPELKERLEDLAAAGKRSTTAYVEELLQQRLSPAERLPASMEDLKADIRKMLGEGTDSAYRLGFSAGKLAAAERARDLGAEPHTVIAICDLEPDEAQIANLKAPINA